MASLAALVGVVSYFRLAAFFCTSVSPNSFFGQKVLNTHYYVIDGGEVEQVGDRSGERYFP